MKKLYQDCLTRCKVHGYLCNILAKLKSRHDTHVSKMWEILLFVTFEANDSESIILVRGHVPWLVVSFYDQRRLIEIKTYFRLLLQGLATKTLIR
jgi:hypothetical protein